MKQFEDLFIWSEARKIVNKIYKMMQSCKDFGFRDQIQRAAVSIMNNIAEGFCAGSDKLNVRYLYIARGSAGEVKSMTYLCQDFHFCTTEIAYQLRNELDRTMAGIRNMITHLTRS